MSSCGASPCRARASSLAGASTPASRTPFTACRRSPARRPRRAAVPPGVTAMTRGPSALGLRASTTAPSSRARRVACFAAAASWYAWTGMGASHAPASTAASNVGSACRRWRRGAAGAGARRGRVDGRVCMASAAALLHFLIGHRNPVRIAADACAVELVTHQVHADAVQAIRPDLDDEWLVDVDIAVPELGPLPDLHGAQVLFGNGLGDHQYMQARLQPVQ